MNLLSFSLYRDYSYSLLNFVKCGRTKLGVEFLRTISRLEREYNFALLDLRSPQKKKSKSRHFFLRPSRIKTERNEQNIVKYVQSCCFADVSCKTRERGVTWTRMPDGKANGCSQWFLFLRSAACGLEKPLLTG